MNEVRPTCLALVLCDRVGRVSHSGRASPIGVFQVLTARSFPTISRPFSAWMHLTQGNGHTRLRLVIERLLPDEPECEILLAVRFSLHFADPNEVREHVIEFGNGLELPCEGSYRARLTVAGVTILSRPFGVATG